MVRRPTLEPQQGACQQIDSAQLARCFGPSSRKRKMADHDFLDDVRTLRERAKESLDDGAVTVGYGCDVKQSIALLRTVVATESVCVLRYTMHSIASERSVIEHYRELIRHFADKDPTTRVVLEDILLQKKITRLTRTIFSLHMRKSNSPRATSDAQSARSVLRQESQFRSSRISAASRRPDHPRRLPGVRHAAGGQVSTELLARARCDLRTWAGMRHLNLALTAKRQAMNAMTQWAIQRASGSLMGSGAQAAKAHQVIRPDPWFEAPYSSAPMRVAAWRAERRCLS